MLVSLKTKLDSIEDPKKRSFAWRFYNFFKVTILPAFLLILLIELEGRPESLSTFLDLELWDNVFYAVIFATIVSAAGGVEKTRRME